MSSYYTPTKKEKAQILDAYTYTDEVLYLNGTPVTRQLSHVPGAKIMNVAVIIGVLTGRPPVRGNFCNVKPKYTNCEGCGEPLPESEIRMQSAYHFKCWDDMIRAGWDKEEEARAKKWNRDEF